MKKIIALSLVLVLALSMATVAFAADPYSDTGEPGEKYAIAASEFANASATYTSKVIDTNYFTSDYFTVSYKVDKGSALLESVKFDDDGALIVKFKANYKLESPAIDNFKFKELKVKTKKEAKDTLGGTIAKNVEFAAITRTGTVFNDVLDTFNVGYTATQASTRISTGTDDGESTYLNDNTINITANGFYKFKKDGVSFKDITFSNGAAYAEFRVFDGDKFYLGTDAGADLDIVKANPTADLEFISFKGNPTLNSSAKVEINGDEGDFLYEIKDGKLVKTNFKWDADAFVFTGKTTTLGSYVVSDIELKNAASSADEDTKNPNTGANDVVGVAVALAVVSLVAAGAVSLKK